MQKYLKDHFVSVRIEDRREAFTAAELGLSQEGYPNIAVYAPSGEFVGRVVGFGGRDPWFAEVKETVATGERLAAARETAVKDGAKLVDVAEILLAIPDRTKDAQAVLEDVPAKVKKGKPYKALVDRIEARVAWGETQAKVDALMKGVNSREGAQGVADQAIAEIDGFLKAHGDADAESGPAALAKKGFFLMIQDKSDAAVEVAKTLLEKFPQSDQAKALLRGLR